MLAAQTTRGWIADVRAAELAAIAGMPDAARRLGARRGLLVSSPANQSLARMLRERPADFGGVGSIVLGADAVELQADPGGFTGVLHVIGAECFDGFQRLGVLAEAWHSLAVDALASCVLRLEIVCGSDRDRIRGLHDVAHRYVNESTAQDLLIRSPQVLRLMQSDWEGGFFDPRRGTVSVSGGRAWTMADVTRGLACLSAEARPDGMHQVMDQKGLEALWSDHTSALHGSIFHERVEPIGVMRAVEAWHAARRALDAIPKNRRKGHGHLIEYAPDLICWTACRDLRLDELHNPRPNYPWAQAIDHQLPALTVRAADWLVQRYSSVRADRMRPYKVEAPELELWLKLLGLDGARP
ncbi:hypothetical protein ACGFSB_21545 [Streptomyces sp. NPDC048441]|uniref:hypothetical protein n=1 Tax=Streptomyces sp. NPDC048441 TaxID=3365552 RepID=UPI00371C8092